MQLFGSLQNPITARNRAKGPGLLEPREAIPHRHHARRGRYDFLGFGTVRSSLKTRHRLATGAGGAPCCCASADAAVAHESTSLNEVTIGTKTLHMWTLTERS